jgi:hypothetical protein
MMIVLCFVLGFSLFGSRPEVKAIEGDDFAADDNITASATPLPQTPLPSPVATAEPTQSPAQPLPQSPDPTATPHATPHLTPAMTGEPASGTSKTGTIIGCVFLVIWPTGVAIVFYVNRRRPRGLSEQALTASGQKSLMDDVSQKSLMDDPG